MGRCKQTLVGGAVNKHNLLQMQECTVTHSHLSRTAGQVHNLAHVVLVSNPYSAAPTPPLNTFTTRKAENWRGFPGFLLPLCPASLSDVVANLLAFLKTLKVQPALEKTKKKPRKLKRGGCLHARMNQNTRLARRRESFMRPDFLSTKQFVAVGSCAARFWDTGL